MLALAREEAREAFKPYMGVPFLTLVEAKASGYEDAGNPELRMLGRGDHHPSPTTPSL
jgi:hypothetical protein